MTLPKLLEQVSLYSFIPVIFGVVKVPDKFCIPDQSPAAVQEATLEAFQLSAIVEFFVTATDMLAHRGKSNMLPSQQALELVVQVGGLVALFRHCPVRDVPEPAVKFKAGPCIFTVTDLVTLPTLFEQVRLYVLVEVKLPVLNVPLLLCVPDQSPVALQVSTLAVDQFKVVPVLYGMVTLVRFPVAVNEREGPWMFTCTDLWILLIPSLPEQPSVKVVGVLKATVHSEPIKPLAPNHPLVLLGLALAEQADVLWDSQLKKTWEPEGMVMLFKSWSTLKVSDGTGAAAKTGIKYIIPIVSNPITTAVLIFVFLLIPKLINPDYAFPCAAFGINIS